MTPPVKITPSLLPSADWREFRTISTSRADIAVLVWAIVATFCGDPVELTVSGMQSGELVESCEGYIRDHAEEAEQTTIEYGRHRPSGEVIMDVLVELDLADDYLRIKRSEQHMAFEEARDA